MAHRSCHLEHAGNAVDHGGWFVSDLAPCDPGCAVTGGEEDLIAQSITLKSHRCSMCLFAVGLNCQPLLLPKQVYLKAVSVDAHPCVASGSRKTLFNQSRQESRLEATSQHWMSLQRAAPGDQDRAQTRGPPPASAREDAIDLIDIECPHDCRLLDEVSHRAPTRPPSHIHQGPGRVRARNLISNLDLIRSRHAYAVPTNALDLATGPGRGMTSTMGNCLLQRPSSSAALPWDRTVPSPQESTAASRRPFLVIALWPTANAPRKSGCREPNDIRSVISASLSPNARN